MKKISMNSITSHPTTLTGTINNARHYDVDRGGYAFADCAIEADGRPVNVFLHRSACVRVVGHNSDPRLTTQSWPTSYLIDGPNATHIVAEVVMGRKGPRAVRWGLVPDPDEVKDFVRTGKTAQFIGGHVQLMMRLRTGNMGMISGLLKSVYFERGELVIGLYRTDYEGRHGQTAAFPSHVRYSYSPRYSRTIECPEAKYSRLELRDLVGFDKVDVYLSLPGR